MKHLQIIKGISYGCNAIPLPLELRDGSRFSGRIAHLEARDIAGGIQCQRIAKHLQRAEPG